MPGPSQPMMDETDDPELKVQFLKEQLKKKDDELLSLQKKLDRNEKRLEKTDKYNEDLLKQVDSLSRQLHKYRSVRLGCDQGTQTSVDDFPVVKKDIAEDNWISQSENANVSVAECVRAVAEEALQKTSFVFDQQSGFYYDQTSGYYYDPENALYYNSLTGVYYTYDERSQEYLFHSQVDLAQFQTNEVPVEVSESSPKKKSKRKQKDDKVPSMSKKQTKSDESQGETCKPSTKYEPKVDAKVANADSSAGKSTPNNKCNSELKLKREIVEEDEPGETRNVQLPKKDKDEIEIILLDNDDVPGDMQVDDEQSVEEGECTDSSRDSLHDSASEDGSEPISSNESIEDVSESWPPCIRCMVEESSILNTPVGTLFLVTCSGASVGREKTNDVCLPDIQISKVHAVIEFNESEKRYTISDVGSQNGTTLNGTRLSEAKETSEKCEINHNDLLELGGIKLRLHIHPGVETCDQCEPGQVQAAHAAAKPKPTVALLTKAEKELQRRKQLKQIRRKFGLESSLYEEPRTSTSVTDSTYNDRAEERRKKKGIDNPFAKTETASMDVAINKKNKGFKMLEKMGWSEGKSLGKSQDGITEPISVEMRNKNAGLGCPSSGLQGPAPSTKRGSQKHKRWTKTQERFGQLPDRQPDLTEGQSD